MDIEGGFPNDEVDVDRSLSTFQITALIGGCVIVSVVASLSFYVARSNWWYIKYLVARRRHHQVSHHWDKT